MHKEGIKGHLAFIGKGLGIGLLGLAAITVPSIIISNGWAKDIKYFGEKTSVLEREIIYNIADKNCDKMLDSSETYQLGLELKVIKDNEEISYQDLAKRIENAPISQVEDYIDRNTANPEKN
jgi:hypothetical protein